MKEFAYFASIIFGIGVFIVFMFFRVRKRRLSALLLKSFSSCCFIFTACLGVMYNTDAVRYAVPIIMGLLFGLLGDIWLDLKWIYEKDSITFLWWGFSCFLVGHLFYVFAIFTKSKIEVTDLLICLAVSAVLSFINLLTAKPLKLNIFGHRGIILGYVIALFFSTTASLTAMIRSGFQKPWILLSVGLVLFVLSDAILNQTFFGKNKDSGIWIVSNHFLYYTGQFLIATSIFFI